MMNIKKIFSDLLNGFKNMFKSNDNIKVILIMVLALFIILFAALGGCSKGCNCSCGDSENSGDIGVADDDNSNAGSELLYEGMTFAAASIKDEYQNAAVTFYYPAEVYTFTEDSSQFWANWVGDLAIYAEGKFSIQPSFDYISNSYKADGSSCATFEEVKQSMQERYGSNPETYGELNLGSNNGFWYVYGGYVTVVFPVLDTNLVAEIYVIPENLDQNAADATSKAAALMSNEELLAILEAIQITTIDTIPDASAVTF